MRVRHELKVYDRVLSPSDVTGDAGATGGAGARILGAFDRFALLQLQTEEPSRSFSSYVHWLREYTGTTVSKSTVSGYYSPLFGTKAAS